MPGPRASTASKPAEAVSQAWQRNIPGDCQPTDLALGVGKRREEGLGLLERLLQRQTQKMRSLSEARALAHLAHLADSVATAHRQPGAVACRGRASRPRTQPRRMVALRTPPGTGKRWLTRMAESGSCSAQDANALPNAVCAVIKSLAAFCTACVVLTAFRSLRTAARTVFAKAQRRGGALTSAHSWQREKTHTHIHFAARRATASVEKARSKSNMIKEHRVKETEGENTTAGLLKYVVVPQGPRAKHSGVRDRI